MLAPILGAVGSLASSFLGSKSASDANKAQARQAQLNYEHQREFAEKGIRWKVKDAKAAGIHPLYALGANTVSYAPSSIGSVSPDYSQLADAGQNIGRAIDATRTTNQRAEALANTATKLQLEGLHLDNEFKRAQLASSMATVRQNAGTPGLPAAGQIARVDGIEGQGQTPQIDGPVIKNESRISPATAEQPAHSYGYRPEVDFYPTNRGGYAPMVPEGLSESFEQDWYSFYQWLYRNKIAPTSHPNVPLAPLHEWTYDVPSGQWYQKNKYMGKHWRWNK